MGQGQSGERLNAAVISYVIQSGKPEFMALRKHLSDASRRNTAKDTVTRKQFHSAENTVTVDQSDRDIFERMFTLFDKSGAGTVTWRDFLSGLALLSKGESGERLFLAMELYDVTNRGSLDATEIKFVFRALNQAASALGDPILSLDQLEELVETVFASVDDQMLESAGDSSRLKYEGAISEFVAHPIVEAYLARTSV